MSSGLKEFQVVKMPPLSFQIIRQLAVGNVYAVLSVPLTSVS